MLKTIFGRTTLQHNTPVQVPNGRVGRVKPKYLSGVNGKRILVTGKNVGQKWSYFEWYNSRHLTVLDEERFEFLQSAWEELDLMCLDNLSCMDDVRLFLVKGNRSPRTASNPN